MLTAGATEYPMCLLDTNAVSEMVKGDASPYLRHFYEWACDTKPVAVPCFTIYTIMELRQRPGLFERFVERFQHLPCVMVKGYAHLLEEEVANYPNPALVEPCAIAFTPLGGEGNQLANLPQMLGQFEQREQGWLNGRAEMVNGMVSLVPNHQPSAGTAYSRDEVDFFVMASTLQQLTYHDESRGFASEMHAAEQAIDINAFPSLKAMSYTVLHKFYVDPGRTATNSDAFDVMIAAALPYVEAVITENHQAEVLRKTKRLDDFPAELEVFTLRDFRDRPPARS